MAVSSVIAVVPAHDEALAIASVVRAAALHVQRVIVVDDGSRDASAAEAARAGASVLRWPHRRGKGAALRAGLSRAFAEGASAAVTLDGDGQHDPGEIPLFLAALAEGADLVVGDRSAEFDAMPTLRRWANRTMSALLSVRLGSRLADTQCGFRLITRSLYERMDLEASHFEVESEMLLCAVRAGATPVAVPVSARYGRERSKIRPVPDAYRFLRLLLRQDVAGSRHLDRPEVAV